MRLLCKFIVKIIRVRILLDELLRNKREVIIGGLGAVINDSNIKVYVVYFSELDSNVPATC